MHLEARTSQRQDQRLLPQMLQSIEVLQLATADLLQLVSEQLEVNEALELGPVSEASALAAEVVDASVALEREWDAPGVRRSSDESDGRRALLEAQPAVVDELQQSIRLQSAYRGLEDELAAAVRMLAERLDDRGLLPVPLEQIAAEAGVDRQLLDRALRELQTMEPRGLGASSGVEAMLLQAAGDPDFATIEQLLTDHLDALARNKLPEVARTMELELEELVTLIDRMRALSPAPAADLHVAGERAVVPDVEVWIADGDVQVALTDGTLPQLHVNEHYRRISRDRSADRELRQRLRGKVRAANDLIVAIHSRQATLLRVAGAVFDHQRPFLERGRSALRPLRMADVARELGMHSSTISRAIAGKHVATPFGTFALRDFCVGGSADGAAQAGHARTAVAQHIAAMVQAEDRSSPWSDDALVAQLGERGVKVARRTVTKLRQELGIPSSYLRRQHGLRKDDK